MASSLKAPSHKDVPRLRSDPLQEEADDGRRVAYVKSLWESQTWALQARDRQIEENVRMLAGQQWHVYSSILHKWVDVSRFLTDYERRWRQRPVINRLLYWFMLTHARMTENPPVVTFQPSTSDRADARLAEVMDTVYKTLWIEQSMPEILDRFFAWLIPGGAAYLKSRIDLSKGDFREFVGPAVLEHQGAPRLIESAPYDREGNPLARLTEDGTGYEATGAPFRYHEGALRTEVLSPLEVRGEWGPKPWHEKRWHLHRTLISVEEVYDIWGVRCEPDTTGHDAGELERLLFGSGYFGAADNRPEVAGFAAEQTGGLVTINEFWHAPTQYIDGMAETRESPGGRLLVTTPKKVLYDGPRPVKLRGTSPIQGIRFVDLPGRPAGTTPQEMQNPVQRTYNRGWAQILEHRNLVSNPTAVIDEQSGLEEEQLHNRPGAVVKVTRRDGVPALEYVSPPRLSDDVFKTQQMLVDEMNYLGNLEGAEGSPPTRDASGELVKELRFNSDRFIGPTMRRAVFMMQRLVEDWMGYLPLIWDEEKLLSYAGEDNVVRTVTVLPEMWAEGKVNVQVDVESMLPEGRGERQARVFRLYADGLLGEPGSAEAQRRFYDLARFPHMGRANQPGGVDQVTAQQENGKLVQGTPADRIPVADWYDDAVHLAVHEEFMKSPEFLELGPEVQKEFMRHREVHRRVLMLKQMQQAQQAAQMTAIAAGGPPEEGGEGGGSQGGGGSPEPSSNGGPPRQFEPEPASAETHVPRGGRKMEFPRT